VSSADVTETREPDPRRGRGRNWPLLLLVPPYVGLLWVPFYSRITPELWGIPFFVWYQFAWIVVGSVLTFLVYAIRR
jgi:hypothetical protein